MSRSKDRNIEELLSIAPPPNEYGVTFFTEKTLNKLNSFELAWLRSMLENYYVPRIKPIEEFSDSFRCPVCKTRFEIKAVE